MKMKLGLKLVPDVSEYILSNLEDKEISLIEN